MIEIIDYKPLDKGILKASFSICIEKWGDFIIHGMTLFQKDNQRWISFPSKEYEFEGKRKYMPYNRFKDSDKAKSFNDKVIAAIDLYLSLNHG